MKISLLRFATFALAFAGSARAQAVYTFSYQPIDTNNLGPSAGLAINDSGYIAGVNYSINNYPRASFVQLSDGVHGGVFFGQDSYVSGLNNSERAVGYGNTGAANHAAYNDLGGSGGAVDLGTLGGTNSYAKAVNASGQIVGYSQTAGDAAYNAFLWNSGTLSAGNSLGTLGGTNSEAYATNASGQVVGDSQISGNGASHAFLTTGTLSAGNDLGTLGGTNSVASGINASGQVAGYSQIAGDSTQHAFLYTSGATVDLGTAAGFANSLAYGVNDTSLVVGLLHNASGPDHAFVDASGVMLDLNALNISGLPSGWYMDEALGINSSGQIVGAAIDTNSVIHNFMLTPTGVPLPIPEPSAYAALAGLSALGLAMWRRRRSSSGGSVELCFLPNVTITGRRNLPPSPAELKCVTPCVGDFLR